MAVDSDFDIVSDEFSPAMPNPIMKNLEPNGNTIKHSIERGFGVETKDPVEGYKVFHPDWTCRGKKYTCPGTFEAEGEIALCANGIHFCQELLDVFDFYKFEPGMHVAKVVAVGNTLVANDKCVTDKLIIIREIDIVEELKLKNIGFGNCGTDNTGSKNVGTRNTGNNNHGSNNTGTDNVGNMNSGSFNKGLCNSGNNNNGFYNSGDHNTGNYNTGNGNFGTANTGRFNKGNLNTGNQNNGLCNAGRCNIGNNNAGNYNIGDYNSGDFNKCNYSAGVFNTESPKLIMFNKPTNWDIGIWMKSKQSILLQSLPARQDTVERNFNLNQNWWVQLSDEDRACIMELPNFDPEIFKEITGIDVNKCYFDE